MCVCMCVSACVRACVRACAFQSSDIRHLNLVLLVMIVSN